MSVSRPTPSAPEPCAYAAPGRLIAGHSMVGHGMARVGGAGGGTWWSVWERIASICRREPVTEAASGGLGRFRRPRLLHTG